MPRLLLALAGAAAALATAPAAHAAFPGINGRLGYDTPEGGLAILPLSGIPNPRTLAPPSPLPAGQAYGLRFSPDGRSVVYTSDVSGDPEIYRLDVSVPSVPVRLTYSPGRDVDPSWSADGASIAFMSDRRRNEDIWVMDADGTNPRSVASSRAIDDQPEYSPVDPHRIVFESDRTGDYELYLIDDDGTDEVQVTDDADQDLDPTWSPDGRSIAFAGGEVGTTDIQTLELGSGEPAGFLTTDLRGYRQPTWSPDGGQIAFNTSDVPPELVVTDVFGPRRRTVPSRRYGSRADWGILAAIGEDAPPPAGGAKVGAEPGVLFRLPGATAYSSLRARGDYPMPWNTAVNAQPEGRPLPVDIDAKVARGAVLQTTAKGGEYRLRHRNRALEFDLRPLRGCPRGARAGASAGPRNDLSVRRRRGRGTVTTRSRARHVTTATVDTEYRVVETCRKLTIRVLDGKLRVRRTKGTLPGGGKRRTLLKGQRLTIR